MAKIKHQARLVLWLLRMAPTYQLSFRGSERSEESPEPIVTDRGYGFRALLAALGSPE